MDYLINKLKLFESVDDVYALEYYDIIQYWNIYVNDPDNYSQPGGSDDSTLTSEWDISKLQAYFKDFSLKINDFEVLKRYVILNIKKQLTDVLISQGWIPNSEQPIDLIYKTFFRIESSDEIFDKKIQMLLDNYELALVDAKFVNFEVQMIPQAFKNNDMLEIYGKFNINILNNKDADKIIDLSKYKGSSLSINTLHPDFMQSSNLIETIKQLIYQSIDNDFKRIIKANASLVNENYKPILNKDYELVFYKTYFNNDNNLITKKFHSIEDAINDVLLYNTNSGEFYNTLYVDIIAKFNNESHLMKNSFKKTIINNSSQIDAVNELFPFDMNIIKANDLKINTKDPNFNVGKLQKDEEYIYFQILTAIQMDINFWARNWINTNKKQLVLNEDYEIKFIKSQDELGNLSYYNFLTNQECYDYIYKSLIEGINNEPEFDRSIYVAILPLENSNLEGSFIKKINNNYLNKALDFGDGYIDVSIGQEEESNSSNDHKNDLSNKKGDDKGFDMWWIITPVTVCVVIIIGFIVTIIVRKKQKIA